MATDNIRTYGAIAALQWYPQLDYEYYLLNRVRGRVIDTKEHPMQIDAVLVMSNGEIAISGGPRKYEILIYRHDYLKEKGLRTQIQVVDAIDTGERRNVQLLESHSQFLIVVQEYCSFLVFYRDMKQSLKYTNGARTSQYKFIQGFDHQRDKPEGQAFLPEMPIQLV